MRSDLVHRLESQDYNHAEFIQWFFPDTVHQPVIEESESERELTWDDGHHSTNSVAA
jgi:hypothetical protein